MLALMVVLAVSLAANRAEAISLADLINNNGTITIDDKIFSDFSLIVNGGTGAFGPADASGISVTATQIDATHEMLTFSGGFFAGLGVGGPASSVDYLIGYTVSTTNGLPLINDIELSFNGVVTSPIATANVTEQAFVNGQLVGTVFVNTPTNLGTNQVPLGPGGPFTSVTIQKDILLVAAPDGQVSISAINQTISQVPVPEPTSLLFLGLGLAGLGIWKRKSM
jgi:hypothetical protein